MRFETEKDGFFKVLEDSPERFMIYALLCVWQLVKSLFGAEKDGFFKTLEESLEHFVICTLLCVWQVVKSLVGAFVAIDEFLEKVLEEHEKTYSPDEVRDFVDVYIKTRSESEDTHLYTRK